MKQIQITDITLKKLSEDRSISLLFRDKTSITSSADSLGANAIELPAVKNLREDTIIAKTISQNIKNAAVAIPAGFTKEDVAAAAECIKEAKYPRLQIELPVSTVQMEYVYHIKAEKMLDKITELTEEAKKYTNDVEFSALDATRADEDFLIKAVTAAENAGATSVSLSDDAGIALPNEIAELVSKIKQTVSVPVYVQLSDRLGMASASAVSAIMAGVDGLKCVMAGKDALLAPTVSDVISARGETLGISTTLMATKIHATVNDMLLHISRDIAKSENASDNAEILLDGDSTLSQVAAAAQTLGYDLSDDDCGKVFKGLLQVCEKKGPVGAKEFEALIASFAMQAPSTYHFESYTTTSSNLTASMSQVTLRCADEILSGVSTGDGPIDSAFRAIEQSIGYHYEIDDFQVKAVTEGKEALGSALVKLRNNGKLYSGNGISTDIVAASIRAYINALNKIVYEEE